MFPNLYNYHLPPELIAKRPASPRDSARLFVYDTTHDEISFDTFLHLDQYLPKDALLILNDAKVVPARAILRKETGGKVEILFLANEWRGEGPIPVLSDRKLTSGMKLYFDSRAHLEVARQEENIFYLLPHFPPDDLFALLNRKGITPIPKYIKQSGLSEKELRKKYQSVFAKHSSSVAAPTASLHFTDRVFQRLKTRGIQNTFITLDVGLGTFAPVSEENLSSGTLHTEFFSVPAATARMVYKQKRAGGPIVAVGTTAARTLESFAKGASSGPTNIFIRPPHEFHMTDILITNFHLPNTSLMMLVQAFLEHKGAKRNLLYLYDAAIREKFRFYSFGDAMLVL